MIILNILEHTFNVLVPISIFILLFVHIKKISLCSSKNNTKCDCLDNNDPKPKWENTVEAVILISTALVFLVLSFWVLIKIKNQNWIIRIITLPVYLEQIIIIYQSIKIVQNVVKSHDGGMLSFRELTAINTLAYLTWFLKLQNIFEKIIEHLYNSIHIYLTDILIAFIYVLIFSLYIFFICALFSELIIIFFKSLKNISTKLSCKVKIENCEDFWISKIGENIPFSSTLIFQWKFFGKHTQYIHWLRYLLLPVTFVLDIIITLFNVLITLIINSIGYVFILIRLLKRTLFKFINWLLSLSDKRIIAISFRVSIIMALVCIVVTNRYHSIFRVQESSTAVLEFIASAIIIPIIFEWINSFKNNHVNSNKDSE